MKTAILAAAIITSILVTPPCLWGGNFGLEGSREIVVAIAYTFAGALIGLRYADIGRRSS